MALHSLSKLPTTTFALIPRTELDSTTRPNNLQSPWLSANSLSLPPSSLRIRTQEPKLHRFSATVCLSLSTANAEIVSSIEKVPNQEAKYATTGTEAILMGIHIEGDSMEITTSYLLLGIWYEGESSGHKIMVGLGFNEEKAKELESSSTKPGFIDG
ncbi:hypothetical protein ACFX2I_037849 [Malus domestica]|uniref:Clp R domain-containing protein n=1 Tax=Malus domestica TaxID=3750 RepID=A0A498JQP4_MALDO|nr:hypothetical protein DVH24_036034 [Malus domestica]